MRNEARRYVFSVLILLVMVLVGVAYAQTQDPKAVPVTPKDSQENIQEDKNKTENKKESTEEAKSNDPKEEEKAEENKVEEKAIENAEAAPAAAVSKAREFRATAYCLRGRTASGKYVKRGLIAADPRVLPLGSKVELTAGRYSGTYTVADTGGKIKGSKVDIWMPSCREAIRWGNRRIKLTVISKPVKKKRRKR